MSSVARVRSRFLLVVSSALVMVAAAVFGGGSAMAEQWVQSYERGSETEECESQPWETPWQASFGPDSSWSPSWGRWANGGKGGWICTRTIYWGGTPASSSSSGSGGSSSSSGSSARSYALGDIGPGGGLVFLISGGLTYEMAPKTWSGGASDPTIAWCDDTTTSITGAAGTDIGDGSANTTAMQAACTSGAAIDVGTYAGGGQTDWFLPSKDELNAMYNYQGSIVDTATYGFGSTFYWTSSQYTLDPANYAWLQRFSDGGQSRSLKGNPFGVRPVRAF
jgi:hypothetical protein